jgi:hypothetical protein
VKFLAKKSIVLTSMITTLIMAFIVMVIVDPMIDGGNGFNVIALQLSFDNTLGEKIVSDWNIEAFNQWIIMDYIYALSYVIFFSSLILWLEKSKNLPSSIVPYIALSAGIFDWIENSLELWFLNHIETFSSTLFFIHSVFATLKWLALPIIIGTIIKLYQKR